MTSQLALRSDSTRLTGFTNPDQGWTCGMDSTRHSPQSEPGRPKQRPPWRPEWSVQNGRPKRRPTPHPSRVTTRYLYVLPYISPLYQPRVPRPRSSIPILPSLLELPASTTYTSIGGTAILYTEVLILNYLATARYIHFSKRAPMVARELLLRYVGLSVSLLY